MYENHHKHQHVVIPHAETRIGCAPPRTAELGRREERIVVRIIRRAVDCAFKKPLERRFPFTVGPLGLEGSRCEREGGRRFPSSWRAPRHGASRVHVRALEAYKLEGSPCDTPVLDRDAARGDSKLIMSSRISTYLEGLALPGPGVLILILVN